MFDAARRFVEVLHEGGKEVLDAVVGTCQY